jgi:hypothetical protein
MLQYDGIRYRRRNSIPNKYVYPNKKRKSSRITAFIIDETQIYLLPKLIIYCMQAEWQQK